MDKKFVMGIAAMAALTLVSCSSDDLDSFSDNSSKNEAISFDGYLGRSAVAVNGTRGSVETVTNLQTDGFGVFGNYIAGAGQTSDANFFKNQQVTYSTEKSQWYYSPLRYWPAQGHIDFVAYAPYADGTTLTNTSLDFDVKDKAADQKDLLWANAANTTKGTVTFNFAHALSRLGYSVKLEDASSESVATITLNKITLAGTAPGSTTGSTKKAFYTKGTIDLSQGSWTSKSDDRKDFDWFSETPSGTPSVTITSSPTTNTDYLFVIPQDFSTGNAKTDELYVIVEYTIKYTSGTAQPTVSYKVYKKLEKNFEQGKAYTINLNIGLTPIEFNAAVTDWVTTENPINDIPVTWN